MLVRVGQVANHCTGVVVAGNVKMFIDV